MRKNTFLGILAILFWSTNVAFSRSLTEKLGVLTAGSFMFLAGGVLSLIFVFLQNGNFKFLQFSSKKYLFGCGALFAINTISLEVAIGMAANRQQTIVVGLINYLWPVLSLWFSLFILKKKAAWYLPIGILLAFFGMWLVSTNGEVLNLTEILQPGTLAVYLTAMVAAITWGMYSNLSRKWGGEQDSGAVPIFLLISGLLLGSARLFVHESSVLTIQVGIEMAYMILFPTILAYIFWDSAMRKGRMITVVSLSYFIPLFSTVISSLRLSVPFRVEIWVATFLLIIGAYICKIAIAE